GDGRFCVKDVRCLLDDVFLPRAETTPPFSDLSLLSLTLPSSNLSYLTQNSTALTIKTRSTIKSFNMILQKSGMIKLGLIEWRLRLQIGGCRLRLCSLSGCGFVVFHCRGLGMVTLLGCGLEWCFFSSVNGANLFQVVGDVESEAEPDRFDYCDVIVMGDFNEVCFAEERFETIFIARGAIVFNSFITSGGLNNVSLELAQKAMIKWVIEGDENYIFFHGIINKHRNNLVVRGIIADGEWIKESNAVKNDFFSHFRDRFDRPCKSRLTLDMEFPNKLSTDQSHYLESPFSMEEVKGAVWGCGLNKSPGLDGFTFEFYRRPISLNGSLYKIIAKLLANRLVTVMSDLVNEVQCGFIANRQILDGPFMLNEIIHWCKSKKKKTMIFKVNFEKAFDSVRWDFLDDVMANFGFGTRWRDWILSCLKSSRGSILVNGSPTLEFHFYKGLKQGDPLSSFLFILFMENLNLSLHNVVFAGLFKGTVFFRASGLRINLHKSNLIGIVVDQSMAAAATSNIGCMTLNLPFSYLRIIIGGNMSRIKACDDVINKVLCRLSKWKMKILSIGSSLWSRVIELIHGEDGIDLLGYIKKKTGNGENTLFWGEVWKSDVPFSLLYPKIFALESCKFITVANKMAHSSLASSLRRNPKGGIEQVQMADLISNLEGFTLPNMYDRWRWSLSGDGEFSVASVRNLIDDRTLAEVGAKTRWIKYVPIKVNILAWRIKLNNLPSRLNLSHRGLDLDIIFCPSCNSAVESSNHIFFGCPMVKDLYKFLARWWDVSMTTFFSYDEWWNWFLNLRVPSKLKLIFEDLDARLNLVGLNG
nr:hypothetical protein [Tanacetum cinerariifolium]